MSDNLERAAAAPDENGREKMDAAAALTSKHEVIREFDPRFTLPLTPV
jgi:hypothetical protein